MEPRDTVTMGNALLLQGHLHAMPRSLGIQQQRSSKQPFVSFQLSSLEGLPAALFWHPYSPNKLRLLPREAHSPGKLILTSNVRLKEEEGQAKTFLKVTSTGYYCHYIQTPKAIASAGISSIFSNPMLIYTSWISSLLRLLKVQKRQWIQISVNLAF